MSTYASNLSVCAFLVIISAFVCYYWKHLCSDRFVSDLLCPTVVMFKLSHMCKNVEVSKHSEQKVISYLGKDICQYY